MENVKSYKAELETEELLAKEWQFTEQKAGRILREILISYSAVKAG